MTAARSRQDKQDDRQDNQDVALAYIKSDIRYIKQQVDGINANLVSGYMTKSEGEIIDAKLQLVQKVVYGFCAIGSLVIAAAITAFFTKGH